MPLADALSAASALGEKEGKRAAGWVFDGNTTRETYARVLKGITDGDPLVMNTIPEPAWGKDDTISVPEVFDELGLDYSRTPTADQDLIADAFMEAAQASFWHEVERVARYHLEGT